MEATYPDVMVDLETTGTAPDQSAILQIAAVKFNIETRQVDVVSMFNRCLSIPAHRFWDEATREWWSRQKPDILQDIYRRMERPQDVIKAFGDWVGYTPEEPHRFWAKPTHFDYTFTSSYFKQFGLHNPFHYRYAVDVNSYLRGLAQGANCSLDNLADTVPFEGDAHNAIYDVLHQIKTVFAALERSTSQ